MNPPGPPRITGGRRLPGLFAVLLGLTLLSALMARSCPHDASPPRITPGAEQSP